MFLASLVLIGINFHVLFEYISNLVINGRAAGIWKDKHGFMLLPWSLRPGDSYLQWFLQLVQAWNGECTANIPVGFDRFQLFENTTRPSSVLWKPVCWCQTKLHWCQSLLYPFYFSSFATTFKYHNFVLTLSLHEGFLWSDLWFCKLYAQRDHPETFSLNACAE